MVSPLSAPNNQINWKRVTAVDDIDLDFGCERESDWGILSTNNERMRIEPTTR